MTHTSGPGIHFRKSITLIQLFEMFPGDATAEAWFEEHRWGQAGKPTHCPICGSTHRICKIASRQPLSYGCGSCRRHFSVRVGTLMHRSPIPLCKLAIAIYLWATSFKDGSSMKLHRDLGITQKSAYFLAQRLPQACSGMPFSMEESAEAGETYLGGKRKNMSLDKRQQMTGTGTVGKTAVAGMKDRPTKQCAARVLPTTDADSLQRFVRDPVLPGVTLYADESHSYKGMPEYHRASANHSALEYVRQMAHTNGIESFWSPLKHAYIATFHHASPQHLHRYVNEFVTRFNMHAKDTISIMANMVLRMVGKRLTCHALVHPVGIS